MLGNVGLTRGVLRGRTLLALAAVFGLMAADQARADSVEFEAEWYDSLLVRDEPGDDDTEIATVACEQASGGYAVVGIDRFGEWIGIPFTVERRFCFIDSVRSAGSSGFHRWLQLSVTAAGDEEVIMADSVYTMAGGGDE